MALPNFCPLCSADFKELEVITRHVYGDKEGSHAFYHCLNCDAYFQYPALSPEEESKFYAAEFENFMAGRSGKQGGWQGAESHILANESTKIRRMKYLSSHISDEATILEIGCSSGFMLFPLKELGHTCTGIEPSGYFSEYVYNHGIQVHSSIEDLIHCNPEKRFDIIMHFFVLEHIGNPLSFLKTQLSLLKKGGKIIFEIPNVADALYSVYDIPAFERFYWSVAHPWYFSEASLKYILLQLDQPYEILLDQRYDLSNHITWARDGKPGGMSRYSELLGNDLEELYKKELIKKRKCDTIIAIITKN